MKFNDFINQCASDSVNATPTKQSKRDARLARIRELEEDEGCSHAEAVAWVDFEGDYKANASAR